MGKCVSKQPSALTIVSSTTDLAIANNILGKFADNTDYISLKDDDNDDDDAHRNQLCEYFCRSGTLVDNHQHDHHQHHHHQHHHHHHHLHRDHQHRYNTNSKFVDNRESLAVWSCFSGGDGDSGGNVGGNGSGGTEQKIHDDVFGDANNNNKNNNNINDSFWENSNNNSNTHNDDDDDDDDITTSPVLVTTDGSKEKKKHRTSKNTNLKNHKNILDKVDRTLDNGNNCEYDECHRQHQLNYYLKDVGQSESKKTSKKANSNIAETKGTAMSFGFRKKTNTTPKKTKKEKGGLEVILGKKKNEKCQQKTTNEYDTNTILSSNIFVDGIQSRSDDNGNSEPAAPAAVIFEKVGSTAVKIPINEPKQLQLTDNVNNAAEQQISEIEDKVSDSCGGAAANMTVTTSTNRVNRFGFKGTNIVRPASTGIAPKYQIDFHDNLENNNVNQQQCGGSGRGASGNYSNINSSSNNNSGGGGNSRTGIIKRRSKSAHSGRAMTPNQSDSHFDNTKQCATNVPKINQKTITFNLNNNSNEQHRRQMQQQQQQQQQQLQQHHLSSSVVGASVSRPMSYTVHPPQYTVVNTGMHTNVIVRPTPKTPAASYAKFTLQTTSLPKPEFAVPVRVNLVSAAIGQSGSTGARAKETAATEQQQQKPHSSHMDQKTAKQMANSNRRGFSGSREISADSGIASLDTTFTDNSQHQLSSSSMSNGGGRNASPQRSRSRPRNLQMIMNGRHKFEVRDLDDPLSSESLVVEPLALPKLPSAFSSDNQTAPLSGLVRSNTVLSRELFFRTATVIDEPDNTIPLATNHHKMRKSASDESESVEEEKLYLDRSASEKDAKKFHHFKELNTCSSKTSSPCSSRVSWCNAGESLAVKDCSSLSISSSDDSKDQQNDKSDHQNLPNTDTDQLSPVLFSEMHSSFVSSLTESAAPPPTDLNEVDTNKLDDEDSSSFFPLDGVKENFLERPDALYNNNINKSKFAEIAAAGSEFLLDDETSPTDSLVSSTESEDAMCKKQKHKANEEIQEKDIDEISPELEEVCSPVSPGTPTHASRSLSLSDCGRDFLIDDEIADQPALVFNDSTAEVGENNSHKGHSLTDTPTLKETSSMRSLKSQSKARNALKAAIELSLRTPLSLRKAVLNRAESLDTLSPCESLCSDDLMMDFDANSSMDSIDKLSNSLRSQSGSALHKLDDTQLFAELENKGNEMMKELNTILRVHARTADKDSVIANLPARATRLLNRSRLQQQCQLSNTGSDSPKSIDSSFRRTPSRASSLHHSVGSSRDMNSSSDDLMLYDKSFRNAMIQDVLHFKKQLLRLRRILQETETLNPFDSDNGQIFASCGIDGKLLDDIDLSSLTSSTIDDPLQELADLRRQVVYLQGQVEDRDRTIRLLQTSFVDKHQTIDEKNKSQRSSSERECINMATQTERTRPLSIGPDGLSRSKPEYTSYTTYFPVITTESTIMQQPTNNASATTTSAFPSPSSLISNQTRRHTIISTTFTNYNQISPSPRRSSIGWEKSPSTQAVPPPIPPTYKPVKITLIGDPIADQQSQSNGGEIRNITGKCVNNIKQDQQLLNGNNRVDDENRKNLLNGGQHHHKIQQNDTTKTSMTNGKRHHHLQNGNGSGVIDGKNDKNLHHHHNHHSHRHHQQKQQQQQQQQHFNGTHKIHRQVQHQHITPTVTIV